MRKQVFQQKAGRLQLTFSDSCHHDFSVSKAKSIVIYEILILIPFLIQESTLCYLMQWSKCSSIKNLIIDIRTTERAPRKRETGSQRTEETTDVRRHPVR